MHGAEERTQCAMEEMEEMERVGGGCSDKKGSLSRILESPSRGVGSIWKQQVEWTAERTLDGRGVWKWISSSLLVRPTFFEEMVFAPFCPCHSTHFAIAFQQRYWLPILLQPLFHSRPPFQFSFGTYTVHRRVQLSFLSSEIKVLILLAYIHSP